MGSTLDHSAITIATKSEFRRGASFDTAITGRPKSAKGPRIGGWATTRLAQPLLQSLAPAPALFKTYVSNLDETYYCQICMCNESLSECGFTLPWWVEVQHNPHQLPKPDASTDPHQPRQPPLPASNPSNHPAKRACLLPGLHWAVPNDQGLGSAGGFIRLPLRPG